MGSGLSDGAVTGDPVGSGARDSVGSGASDGVGSGVSDTVGSGASVGTPSDAVGSAGAAVTDRVGSGKTGLGVTSGALDGSASGEELGVSPTPEPCGGASVAADTAGDPMAGSDVTAGAGIGAGIGAGGAGAVPGVARVSAPAGTSTSVPAELTATSPSVVRSVEEPSASTCTSNFVPRTAATSDGVRTS